jgi:hypothetical protein
MKAKDLLNKEISWTEEFDPYQGIYTTKSGRVVAAQGRNIMVDGNWLWLPSLRRIKAISYTFTIEEPTIKYQVVHSLNKNIESLNVVADERITIHEEEQDHKDPNWVQITTYVPHTTIKIFS